MHGCDVTIRYSINLHFTCLLYDNSYKFSQLLDIYSVAASTNASRVRSAFSVTGAFLSKPFVKVALPSIYCYMYFSVFHSSDSIGFGSKWLFATVYSFTLHVSIFLMDILHAMFVFLFSSPEPSWWGWWYSCWWALWTRLRGSRFRGTGASRPAAGRPSRLQPTHLPGSLLPRQPPHQGWQTCWEGVRTDPEPTAGPVKRKCWDSDALFGTGWLDTHSDAVCDYQVRVSGILNNDGLVIWNT